MALDGLKIICFHGFGTSGEFMKFQMASWVEKFPNTKFLHVDGSTPFPAIFTADPDIIQFHGDEKMVFDNFSSGYRVDSMFPLDVGYEVESHERITARKDVQRIIDIIVENGGVDGIFGFSQGSLIAQMLVYFLETGQLNSVLKPEQRPYFAMLACPHPGFITPSQFKIPAFMFFGSFDNITRTCYMQLMRYRNSIFTGFEGGHKVPVLTTRLQRLVVEFVNRAKTNRKSYIGLTNDAQTPGVNGMHRQRL